MQVAAPPGPRWFEPLAEFLGPAYLRYSFTKGTEQEVAFLVGLLHPLAGRRVLDVGCGPGRHANALAAAAARVVGVDISHRFVALAAEAASTDRPGETARFAVGDARSLPVRPGSFDAVISLCQGGFGLLGGHGDAAALGAKAAAVAPGGMLVVSAFSAYFQVRWLEDGDDFDADHGVNHEHTELRDEGGATQPAELWTTCFTPRELRLLMAAVGLETVAVHSVAPGDYAARPPDLDHPELLVVARRLARA